MTVVVTGAAGGIGRAVVEALAGHRVVRQDVAPFTLAGSDRSEDVVGDLLDAGVRSRLLDALGDEPLEAVVLAHGVAGAGRLNKMTPEASARIMAINFEAVVATWDSLSKRVEADGARTVIVSSQAGQRAEKDNGVYCASKSALIGWARALERRGTSGMRIICPGATETSLLRQALEGMAHAEGVTYGDVLTRRNAAVPAGRLGRTEEIAATIAWLAQLTTPALVSVGATGGEVLS